MKIDPDKFDEYMIAKDAIIKIYNAANYHKQIQLTSKECTALLSQKMIDLAEIESMLA